MDFFGNLPTEQPLGPDIANRKAVTDLPDDQFAGCVHFAFKDGTVKMVDGDRYDKDVMVKSVQEILNCKDAFKYPADRQAFLMKVCKAFSIPTSIANAVTDDSEFVDILKESNNKLTQAKKADELGAEAKITVDRPMSNKQFVEDLEISSADDGSAGDESEADPPDGDYEHEQ